MFNLRKKGLILVLSTIADVKISLPNLKNWLLLNDQKCEVKKVIIDNDCMTFPYKIKVDKCVGSCNDKDDPYFKVCTPDIAKNVSVKVLDLISQQNVLKISSFIKVVNVIVY